MTTVPAYLINLDDSTDRLASSLTQFEGSSLRPERVPGVDGRGKPVTHFEHYDGASARAEYGRDMLSGELGCYLSHVRTLERFVESGASMAVVFEDDFKVRTGGWAALDAVTDYLAANPELDWDVVNLVKPARQFPTKLARIATDAGPLGLQRAYYFPVLATALLWSRRGAETFLARALTPCGPFDHVLRGVVADTGGGLALDRSLFTVTGAESDIEAASSHQSFGRRPLDRETWFELRRQARVMARAWRTRRRWLRAASADG